MTDLNKDLSFYRESYEKGELRKENTPENPIELFQSWFYEADESEGVQEANAMNISTIGLDGFPKNRVVLLKRFTWEGFMFYTNYTSEKGRAIEANPNVCLSFFWPFLERQIIIKGKAEKISENLSDGYFETRPRGSQLGAWASDQSTVVENKSLLEAEQARLEKEFEGKPIPRPKHWGGILVKPVSIEFWQGRPSRLHDRIRYTLNEETFDWIKERLNP